MMFHLSNSSRTALALRCAVLMAILSSAAWAAKKPIPATIDTSKVHQEIAGFGGSEAYDAGFLARHPHSKEMYDALFGPENGLHIDFLRLRDMYRYQDTPHFDPDAETIVKSANALRSNPLTIVMSSWSPPANLKSNQSEKNGGTLFKKDGKYEYAEFAAYWKDSVTAYRAIGIDPTYISLQNEPDWTATYESCRFNPTEAPYKGETFAGYDKAVDAVYAALHELPSPPYMLGPETLGIGFGNVQAFTQAQPASKIYAVAHHLYTGGDKTVPESYVPAMQAIKDENPGRLKFQTEYYTAGGFDTALMIHYSMVTEEVSLYLYWPLAWPKTSETLLNVENPKDPSQWKTPNGWSYTDGYFALKQFSYFIHAGYKRVDANIGNDEVKLSAYISPKHDKLVVVAINTSAKNTDEVKLKLGEFQNGQSVVYRTTFPDSKEQFAKLGPLGAEDRVSLPPHSVATVEITSPH